MLIPLGGMSLGRDPLVSHFLCGTLRPRPAAHTRVPTWDLAIVLQGHSLAPFEPLEEVPAKFLTLKALFLLAISSLKRIGDLQALSVAPSYLEFAPSMVKAFIHPRHFLSLPVSFTGISKRGTPDGVAPILSLGWHL